MEKSAKLPSEVKWATRQRLQFIEIMAFYTGVISRSTLARAFGISDPAATKDLKLYNEYAPDNLNYNPALFGFEPSENFQPVFSDLDPAVVLPMFAENLISVDNPSGDTNVYGISVNPAPAGQTPRQKPAGPDYSRHPRPATARRHLPLPVTTGQRAAAHYRTPCADQ